MYGQEVTNGGFETNVFDRNTDKEFIQNTMMINKNKMIRTKGRMNHGPYKDFMKVSYKNRSKLS